MNTATNVMVFATALCFLMKPSADAQTRSAVSVPALAQGTRCTASERVVAALKELASESRIIRRDLLELRLEAQDQIIARLEQQLHDVEGEQIRHRNDETAYQTQLAELDQVLSVHRGDQDERRQMEQVRAALADGAYKEAQNILSTLKQRLSELMQRLNTERQKLQDLRRRAQEE
jgi:hypothetical protein